jgi:Rod binding domain-containing protein
MNPLGAIGALGSAQATAQTEKADKPDPKLLKAARDFEAIFVRQMLKSVEKTTAAGAGAAKSAGQNTYGSMIVDTLSESITAGGGMGLSEMIARSMMASHPNLKGAGPAAGSTPTPLIPSLKAPK